MKKLFVFFLMIVMLVSVVSALPETQEQKVVLDESDAGMRCNQGFQFECKNFYDDSSYYTIAKWTYDERTHEYKLEEQNSLYGYFNTDVNGNRKSANWTSQFRVSSVLVKSGHQRTEFEGGTQGSITSMQDVSHITFCGHKGGGNGGGCTGDDCGNGNGVPEFPTLTLGVAAIVVGLGLVFLRRN